MRDYGAAGSAKRSRRRPGSAPRRRRARRRRRLAAPARAAARGGCARRAGESRPMQSRRLHASLHAFAARRAARSPPRSPRGDEIGFEVVEEGARGARRGLYCYEPLTGEFVERHWERCWRCRRAATRRWRWPSLGGLEEYLDTYAAEHRGGVPSRRTRCAASRAASSTRCGEDFELSPERFEPAYRELRPGDRGARRAGGARAAARASAACRPRSSSREGVMLAPLERARRAAARPRLAATDGARRPSSRSCPAAGGRDRGGARPPARPADRAAPLRARDRARAAGLDPRPARGLARAADPRRRPRRRRALDRARAGG